MPISYQTDGAIGVSGANNTGGMSSGIGVGSNASGPIAIQGVTVADFEHAAIGGGSTSTSASNIGNMVQSPVTFVAGSGYTNGTYRIESSVVAPLAAAAVDVTVAGGAITAVTLVRPGGGFASAPTFAITALGGGTGGSITSTVGTAQRVQMLGAAYGTNKGGRYLTAVGTVANNAAISGGYLNRSGRQMVVGESAWAVAP